MGGHFEIPKKEGRLKEIEELEGRQDFWQEQDRATRIGREKSLLQDVLGEYNALRELYEEFEILDEYAVNDEDESSATEAISLHKRFVSHFHKVEQRTLLSGEMDEHNAIVSINAGAGGTESCDWASMLYRMVNRWAESKGFKVNVLDIQDGDAAGIKSATMTVEGNYAYGLMRGEGGVHRLVRISPFDSNARRHTSFASIFVSPEIDDQIVIDIKDSDIKIDVYRAGGAGGQSVNTTDSAVRITHKESGIVVTCQNERSQVQNKQQAMKVLKSRLYELALEEKRAESKEREAGKKGIEWGAQMRSYVLHPYKMVKDHRTGMESSQAEKVLDGELDQFIDAYLRWDICGETVGTGE